jgi:hypothetical protein
MALVACRECGARVSTEASTCPHCGIAHPAATHALMDVRPGLAASDQPQKRKRRRWSLWLIFGIAIFWFFCGFLWLLNFTGVDTDTMFSGAIPKCNSKTATDLAKQAIEGSPMAKVINITAFDIRDAQEIAYDSNAQKRTCTATALLNSGRHQVAFTLEWANQKQGTVWLQIQQLD